MNIKIYIPILSFLLLSSCSSTPHYTYYHKEQSIYPGIAKGKNTRWIKQQLWAQFHHWKGTPYRYGGTGRKGIDCSAFVQRTFREKFGIHIPRTTWTQVKKGRYVAKNRLRPGDIIFFRIGRHSRHDGIYLGNHQFMHASSSRGVAISDLRRRYWIQHYWTSRRII